MRKMVNVFEYYSRAYVKKNLIEFLRHRWVAIHMEKTDESGANIFVRYIRGKPITINNEKDLKHILFVFRDLRPRTFYGTVNIYRKLETKEDALNYEKNVIKRTCAWDVDSELKNWQNTIKTAKIIAKALEKYGVIKSVYFVWSGRGIHIRIHENAFSNELLAKYKPLDISYSIVKFTIDEVREEIRRIPKIAVENLMDPQRVFTAPLSLHRKLNVVCVPLKYDDLDNFNLDWLNPGKPRFNPSWNKFEIGEADELAELAVKKVGGYMGKMLKKEELPETPRKTKTVRILTPIKFDYKLDDIRLNPNPSPIKGGREFRKGPREAFLKIEDILSHFALGHINLEHALKALRYARYSIIPFQPYPDEIKEKLFSLYDEAIKILEKLRTPQKVKAWLLSHSPPRKPKTILEFLRNPE